MVRHTTRATTIAGAVALTATVALLALTGCTAASADGSALAPRAIASFAPVVDDRTLQQELRASGWTRSPEGLYLRLADPGTCGALCRIELFAATACPTGAELHGTHAWATGPARDPFVLHTAPLVSGELTTVAAPPAWLDLQLDAATCSAT